MAIGDVAVPTAPKAPTKDIKAEIEEPIKKPNDDQGSEWENFSVEKWRDAVYTSRSFFSELFVDTTDFVGKLCDELGGNSEEGPLLVEVGCGTGEALVPLFTRADGNTPRARYTCGMDFNPHFIKYCREQVAPEDQADVRHLVGDAQKLIDLVNNDLPAEWNVQSRSKVVICVGNTVGIMPPDIRKNVYQQMKDLAGEDGYVVVVYWNGNKFGDAVQNFYHKNPKLCGKFTGECIDLDTCTLRTPSGYCTHWTKPEEARAIFEDEIGVEVVDLLEKGNGVMVAGRVRKSDLSVPFAPKDRVTKVVEAKVEEEIKKPNDDQGSEWENFSVEKWRDAVYTSRSFFSELFVDTTNFVGKLCDDLGGNGADGPLLVEVGCGTGEALVPLFTREDGQTPRARYTCGMDFNPHFIKYCREQVAPADQADVRHLVGDAQKLIDLVNNDLPAEWSVQSRSKVVICVGNTVGIMPPDIRKNVYQQMKDLAGVDGYVVVVYWNGNKFGDAVQNFYHKNPKLCGKFTGECIDLDTCTLRTPSGYCTHWTKPEEARAIFEDEIGIEVVEMLEKGNGVMVAGRVRA